MLSPMSSASSCTPASSALWRRKRTESGKHVSGLVDRDVEGGRRAWAGLPVRRKRRLPLEEDVALACRLCGLQCMPWKREREEEGRKRLAVALPHTLVKSPFLSSFSPARLEHRLSPSALSRPALRSLAYRRSCRPAKCAVSASRARDSSASHEARSRRHRVMHTETLSISASG